MFDRFDVMTFVMGISFIVLGIAFITTINFWYIFGFATIFLIIIGFVFVIFGIMMLILFLCSLSDWFEERKKNHVK